MSVAFLSLPPVVFSGKVSEQCRAACHAVLPRGIEISSVPRVGNLPTPWYCFIVYSIGVGNLPTPWYHFIVYSIGVGYFTTIVCKVEQKMYLALRVSAAEHTLQVAYVVLVHGYKQVVVLVVVARDLPGGLTGAADAVLCELAACRGIDWVAYFLGTGGGTVYLELTAEPCVGYKSLHHELGHRTPAYIAVAYKKYLLHVAKIQN